MKAIYISVIINEINFYNRLLNVVLSDLLELQAVLNGKALYLKHATCVKYDIAELC